MHPVTVILIAIFMLGLALSLFPNKMLQGYWSRNCTGRAWKQAFPNRTNKEIRIFLYMFTDSFIFKRKQALSFNPSDKIMDIYNSIYKGSAGQIGGDTMECELFVSEFSKTYGKDPTSLWSNDLTLGQLFAFAHAPNHSFNPGASRASDPAVSGWAG